MSAINYSKWDRIELSDDEDFECHPNVDKKSFIRWKQQEVHRQRDARRSKMLDLAAETETNVVLLERLQRLLEEMPSTLSSPPAAAGDLESPVAVVNWLSEQLRASGQLPEAQRQQPGSPAYDTMIAALLVQIASEVGKGTGAGKDGNKLAAEKDDPTRRALQTEAVLTKLTEHKAKLASRQKQALDELQKLRKEDESKLGVDDLCKPGFDRTILNKSKPPEPEPESSKKAKKKQTTVEILNPELAENYKTTGTSSDAAAEGDVSDEEDIVTSEAAREFSNLDNLEKSFAFISKHPYMVSEKKSDEILAAAFESQMLGKEKTARRCVQQALILKYCSQLGKDGVSLFFKRMAKPGKSLDMFSKDVQETYAHIQKRCKILREERVANAAEGGGRETIQLFTPDPSKPINFQIPTEETNPAGLAILNTFPQDFREALLTKELNKVNKILGKMECAEAEALVEKLGEAGILCIEPEIRDAEQMKKLEEEARKEREMEVAAGALGTNDQGPVQD